MVSVSNKLIGKRIANARKVAKLTQAKLSEKVGISEKYLSRIECGKQSPNISTVIRICDALCVSADKLLSINNINASGNIIQNEIEDFSPNERKQIVEIIKIIMDIKKQV